MAQLLDIPALKKIISNLEDLSDPQKQHITDRWLRYVIWWDSRAAKHKKWHYTLRTIVVIGGVIIPGLIGSAALPDLSGLSTGQANGIQWAAFALSLAVGICAALEELFHHGEIWRDKRAAGEILKGEGWRYFQLTGNYKGKSHSEAYADFAATVEDMIEHEIKDYFLITRPQEEHGKPDEVNHQGTLKTDLRSK